MRNDARASMLLETSREEGCQLFDEPVQKKARVIRSRQQIDRLRLERQSLTLDIDIDGEMQPITVLRPWHSKDNLFVEYDGDTVAKVIHIIRAHGFEEPNMELKLDLPRGISHRKNGDFLVTYMKPDGSKGYKIRKTVDEAIEFQLEHLPRDVHDGADAEQVDGDGHIAGDDNEDEESADGDDHSDGDGNEDEESASDEAEQMGPVDAHGAP